MTLRTTMSASPSRSRAALHRPINTSRLLALLPLLTFLVVAAGCSANHARVGAPMSVRSGASEAMVAPPGDTRIAGIPSDRMYVWTADVELIVDEPTETGVRVQDELGRVGGYVEDMRSYSDSSTIRMRMRVPHAKLWVFLDAISEIGEVAEKRVEGTDVTNEYVDLEARLASKRELRARIEKLLERADSVSEAIRVENELNRVQTEIERMERSLRSLSAQVEFALVDVEIRRQRILGPVGAVFYAVGWTLEKLFVWRD